MLYLQNKFQMKITFYILVSLTTIFEVFGDFLFKKWVLVDQKWFLIVGIVAYLISTVIWAFSLRTESLSKAIAIFTVLSLIIVDLMGVYVFKEQLSNLNILGIALGVVSIILVSL
jgi:multidrug transporter EmrE-like cation transporter